MLALFVPVLALFATVPSAQTAALDGWYRDMYNLEFERAHQTFGQWQHAHPEDPMGPASDAAAYLFGEFERLNILQSEFFTDDTRFETRSKPAPDLAARRAFEAALAKARQLAAAALAKNPKDVSAQFAQILCFGLHADYLALIDKSYLASLGEMKTGRQLAETLLASHPEMKDAYLAVGVENYMLSLKPAPVRWLLRATGAQTDKDTGLRQLKLTAEGGRYLKPFARLLLAVAALRDKNTTGAKALLADLSREFPNNRLYAQELARLH